MNTTMDLLVGLVFWAVWQGSLSTLTIKPWMKLFVLLSPHFAQDSLSILDDDSFCVGSADKNVLITRALLLISAI